MTIKYSLRNDTSVGIRALMPHTIKALFKLSRSWDIKTSRQSNAAFQRVSLGVGVYQKISWFDLKFAVFVII